MWLVVATHLLGRMMNKFVRWERRSSVAQLWELAIFGWVTGFELLREKRLRLVLSEVNLYWQELLSSKISMSSYRYSAWCWLKPCLFLFIFSLEHLTLLFRCPWSCDHWKFASLYCLLSRIAIDSVVWVLVVFTRTVKRLNVLLHRVYDKFVGSRPFFQCYLCLSLHIKILQR